MCGYMPSAVLSAGETTGSSWPHGAHTPVAETNLKSQIGDLGLIRLLELLSKSQVLSLMVYKKLGLEITFP